jgi:hypothetical protein
MSAALVPGRILLSAAWSRLLNSVCWSDEVELGDSWSSGMGGGLGRRGEAGDVMVAVLRAIEGWAFEVGFAIDAGKPSRWGVSCC